MARFILSDNSKFSLEQTPNTHTQCAVPPVEVWGLNGNQFFILTEFKPRLRFIMENSIIRIQEKPWLYLMKAFILNNQFSRADSEKSFVYQKVSSIQHRISIKNSFLNRICKLYKLHPINIFIYND